MEIIKQLYDIARLFEKTEVLETTTKSFVQIAEVELSYRHLPNNPKLISMISDRLRCVWQQGEVKETDNLMHYNVVYKGSNPSCSMAVISLTMRLETQHAQPISPQ